MPDRTPHRIHTIVLTRDRPATLRRCVAELVSQLGRDDALTVLDDSALGSVVANAEVLRAASSRDSCTLCHVHWRTTSAKLKDRIGEEGLDWLNRTHDRDIAPLRNFSLLLAAAVPFESVVLVDDDIVGAEPLLMHMEISGLRGRDSGVVLGVHLRGVSELDIITRLWQGVEVLAQGTFDVNGCDPKTVFRASVSVPPELQVAGRYPSAGCLGFTLNTNQITAFPPGYNEDWLWGHLRNARPDVRVVWSNHVARHDPPSVRHPTDADCIFELTGDLVLDCLEALDCPAGTGPIERLELLAKSEPTADLLPEYRLQKLREELSRARLDEKARTIVYEHGLASLERLSRTGALNVDWRATLAAWCRNATIAMRSFDEVLTHVGTLKQIQSGWTEDRVW